MNNKRNRNISGLLKHSDNLKKDTEKCVDAAIEMLRKNNRKINFSTVSGASGVSTTTLYNNKSIRSKIERLREKAKSNGRKEQLIVDISNERKLREEIKKLKQEKEMLIIQLVKMDELQQENIQLKNIISHNKYH